MDWFQKIVEWNKERNLLALGFDHVKESSFIIEEILESSGHFDSEAAREKALEYAKEMVNSSDTDAEKVVDAFADIIVFATGAIAKVGYDPSKVMDEVYAEISSRTGKLVDGKFVKDKEIVPYKADFSGCLMNNQNKNV